MGWPAAVAMIELLTRVWYRLRDRIWLPTIYRIRRTADRPEVLASGILYVIGHGEHVWEAALRCPNGCGRTLSMNLLTAVKP